MGAVVAGLGLLTPIYLATNTDRVAAGLASLLIALMPISDGNAEAGNGGLRFSVRPSAPDLLHVAFRKQIPQPSAREGWGELRRRGGIDVGDSRFHLTLANESSEPISVLNVHAEVLGSKPTRVPGAFGCGSEESQWAIRWAKPRRTCPNPSGT